MRDLLVKMKPDRFEDIIAVLALYRPGPLGSGMVDTYVHCKHGTEPIPKRHPVLDSILEETNGVILYQEQVMRIANKLAGFSLNEADTLRKAMGKKKPELIQAFKQQFVDGAKANDVDPDFAKEVFGLMEYFGGYGFNKSHSTAYALISYQTAYLKANHPVEFLAGNMCCEFENTEKLVELVEECRRREIPILPPDINRSGVYFSVEEGDKIRFGMGAIKNVGTKAVESIIESRDARTAEGEGPFEDLFDLCESIDLKQCNKALLENLVKAGALDPLGSNRAALFESIEDAVAVGNRSQSDKRSGQMGLFGAPAEAETAGADDPAMSVEPWPDAIVLQNEKDTLGFFLSTHPLARYEEILRRFIRVPIHKLNDLKEDTEVTAGGMFKKVRTTVTKAGRRKGSRMALGQVEDFTGTCSFVIFSEDYEKYQDLIEDDAVVFLRGRVDRRREEPSLRVSEVIPVEKGLAKLTRYMTIRLDPGTTDDDELLNLKSVLQNHKGACPVILSLSHNGQGTTHVQTSANFYILPSEELKERIEGSLPRVEVAFHA